MAGPGRMAGRGVARRLEEAAEAWHNTSQKGEG